MSTYMPCTGCRIRRKKCDQAVPKCSGCSFLNLPESLCVYPSGKNSYRGRNAKEYLEQLKKQNSELYTKQLHYKHLFEDRYAEKYIDFDAFVKLPVSNKAETDFVRKDRLPGVDESERDEMGHPGMLSFEALLQGEPLIATINSKFNANWIQNRDRLQRVKQKLDNEQVSSLNRIRKQVTEMCLGIEPVKESLLNDFLKTAVEFLPNYNIVRRLLRNFFHNNTRRVLAVNEEQVVADFHQMFKVTPDGKVELKDIDESCVREYFHKMALILVILTFPIIHQHYSLPRKTEKPGSQQSKLLRNHTSLFAYAKLMIFSTVSIESNTGGTKYGLVQLIQALTQIRHVEFHYPNGLGDEDPYLHTIAVYTRALCSYARAVGLSADIDSTFTEMSEASRTNLKTLYFSFMVSDLRESFEMGFPTKIKCSELKNYSSIPVGIFINPVIKLYRIYERFQKLESLFTVQNPCEAIEMDFIYELQVMLHLESSSFSVHIGELDRLDLTKTHQNEVHVHTHTLNRKIWIHMFIVTLYSVCVRKTRQFEDNSCAKLARYKTLALKYAFLTLDATVELYRCYQKVFASEHSERLVAIEQLLILAVYTRNAFRRSSIVIAARIYDYIPIESAKLEQLLKDHPDWAVSLKFDESLLLDDDGSGYRKFTLEDLEDKEIDRENDKLFEKFKDFFDYKFLLMRMYKIMKDTPAALENDHYDTSFVKNNYIYLRTMKLLTFIANVMYYRGEIGHKYSKRPSHLVQPVTNYHMTAGVSGMGGGILNQDPNSAASSDSIPYPTRTSTSTSSAHASNDNEPNFIDESMFFNIWDTEVEKISYNDLFWDLDPSVYTAPDENVPNFSGGPPGPPDPSGSHDPNIFGPI